MEYSTSVVRHPAFPWIEESALFALQQNWLHCDIFVKPFPSNEQSVTCAHVATAECLMNFRTPQICLWCREPKPGRSCVSAQPPDVVSLLLWSLPTHDQVLESSTSVTCAASICEVNSKPEQVWHDNDAFFRTPRVALLPFRENSTSTTKLRNGSETKLKAVVMRATETFGARCSNTQPCRSARFLMAFWEHFTCILQSRLLCSWTGTSCLASGCSLRGVKTLSKFRMLTRKYRVGPSGCGLNNVPLFSELRLTLLRRYFCGFFCRHTCNFDPNFSLFRTCGCLPACTNGHLRSVG